MTQEQVGRILGFVLLIALMLGIPYGIMSFCMWDLNPANWDIVARGLDVFGSIILGLGYAASQLPAAQPEPVVQ